MRLTVYVASWFVRSFKHPVPPVESAGRGRSSLIEHDPTLDALTSFQAREYWDELRVFWEGDLELEVPLTHGLMATIETYRSVLATPATDGI